MMRQARSILIAEDDDSIRELTELNLKLAGYDVQPCRDGMEALEHLTHAPPDLILSDVVMPRVDGFELLRTVRRSPRWKTLPFVLMSARVENTDQRMGMSLGADDYLTKPFKAEDLLRTVELRLERAELLREITQSHQHFLSRVLPHELRTPLTGIIGYAELMIQLAQNSETLSPATLADYGRNIGKSGMQLLRLAEDFSLWAEYELAAECGKCGEQPKWTATTLSGVELSRQFRQCAHECGRNPDLEMQIAGGCVTLPVPGVERVLRHLVENAFNFSQPGAKVWVEARPTDIGYCFTVTDRGRGMSPEQIQRIGLLRQFDRDTYEQQGMGLGLALASRLSELSGGELRVEPNVDAPGIRVEFKLPLALDWNKDRLPMAATQGTETD
jgi:DNA-binding response OmpR family regulator